MWCALNNKVPTWDVLQKRSFQGPGWCVLCKRELESTCHLFLLCSFTKAVWREVSLLVGFHCQWEGETLSIAWESWWRSSSLQKHKILPLLVNWGLWLARNKAIFEDVSNTLAIIGALSVGFYKSYPEYIRVARERRKLEVEIDRTSPWAFFDGASQNNVCGGGVVLYLTESHYFVLSMGLGGGTNNFSELLSLKFLLIFSLENGCKNLNFMGDSLNVINWINQNQECRQLRLVHILHSIRLLLQRLDLFTCRHVYRDNNQLADKASKDGLGLTEGSWTVTEFNDDRLQGFYHRTFIEDL